MVSKDDLLNLASQILEILYILFSNDLVLKNLHINDFMLRRTTRGFRAVLINQDFYTKYFSTEPPFTKQNQLHNRRFHVHFAQCNGREWYSRSYFLHSSEPTQQDNLISLCYILCFMAYRSLPWIGLTDSEIKEKKAASEDFVRRCPVYSSFSVSLFVSSQNCSPFSSIPTSRAHRWTA